MAFPSPAQLQLGILRAIQEAGQEASSNDVSLYSLVGSYFPEITPGELLETDPATGEDLLVKRCKSQIAQLLRRQELEDLGAQLVGITKAGLDRLEKAWLPEWGKPPTFEPLRWDSA
jgi:hypothetical protein